MNMNWLIRRAMNVLLHKGIDHVAKRGTTETPQTPEEKAKRQKAQETSARSKQALKIMRRFGRF